MAADPPSLSLPPLPPELAELTLPGFALGDDLESLTRVHAVGAHEATAFYAARVLEALSAAALDRAGLQAGFNAFANLGLLNQYGLLSAAALQWANAIRRTGNAVRHMLRRINADDAMVVVLLTERIVRWFFVEFPVGPRLPMLGGAGRRFALGPESGLRTLLDDLTSASCDARGIGVRLVASDDPWLASTPVIGSLLGEMLLNAGHAEVACGVIDRALAAFPDDVRLNQLMGLHCSRTGRLTEALERLRPLHRRSRDDETIGILAGIHKRIWQAHPADRQSLHVARDLYAGGWNDSRKTNVYLGINAASLSLWLDDREQAATVAREVHGVLSSRAESLRSRHHAALPGMNYWDRVTLAESLLLLGGYDAARDEYRAAFLQHPRMTAAIDVTRSQATAILHAQGRGDRVADVLGPAARSA